MATAIPTKGKPTSVALYPKQKQAWDKLCAKRGKRPAPEIRRLIVQELQLAGIKVEELEA